MKGRFQIIRKKDGLLKHSGKDDRAAKLIWQNFCVNINYNGYAASFGAATMQSQDDRPSVFLDTNVVASYLIGEPSSLQLFSSEILGKIHAAVNPIVMQELFFLSEAREHPDRLDGIEQELSILPLNLEKADEYLKQATSLRNRIAHSNDILILSSASDCDYLVTYDSALGETLANLSTGKTKVVTPEQLVSQLKSKV